MFVYCQADTDSGTFQRGMKFPNPFLLKAPACLLRGNVIWCEMFDAYSHAKFPVKLVDIIIIRNT
jgi:hypothetical protein